MAGRGTYPSYFSNVYPTKPLALVTVSVLPACAVAHGAYLPVIRANRASICPWARVALFRFFVLPTDCRKACGIFSAICANTNRLSAIVFHLLHSSYILHFHYHSQKAGHFPAIKKQAPIRSNTGTNEGLMCTAYFFTDVYTSAPTATPPTT